MIFDLPILYPSGERAGFVGVHYIYPLMGVGLMGIVTLFVGQRAIAFRFLIALPCYAAVIFAYFNIKLWIPHINPASFDAIYWSTDQILRPIVELCIIIRRSVFFFIPYEANFYMTSYILLFYVSFLYHAIKTPKHFGKLIVAALLLQLFGTVIYLAAPAVGPFIYGRDAIAPFRECLPVFPVCMASWENPCSPICLCPDIYPDNCRRQPVALCH